MYSEQNCVQPSPQASADLQSWRRLGCLHCVQAQPSDEIRVRLAGEAMRDDLNGCTHGAYHAGKENAAKVLHKMGK